jgi:hypothetical protein
MSIVTSVPRTRRAFLAAAAATAAFSVASALQRPLGVRAATGPTSTQADYSTRGVTSVPAGRSWVDVNVANPGGRTIAEAQPPGPALDLTQCYASLQRFRAGIHIAAVRPNYPSPGQIRIYLNASVRSSVPVVWWILWPPEA